MRKTGRVSSDRTFHATAGSHRLDREPGPPWELRDQQPTDEGYVCRDLVRVQLAERPLSRLNPRSPEPRRGARG
jgi:hypothetical protein